MAESINASAEKQNTVKNLSLDQKTHDTILSTLNYIFGTAQRDGFSNTNNDDKFTNIIVLLILIIIIYLICCRNK